MKLIKTLKLIKNLKWIFALVILFSLYAVINFWLQKLVILPSFVELEQEEASTDIARCIDAIHRESHHIVKIAGDWAKWDDTYRFVEDRNPGFITSNLQWETLEKDSDINLIYFIDLKGTVVWGEIFSSQMGGRISISEFSEPVFDPNHYLLQHAPPASGVSGLINTSHGPMMIAALPVLTSLGAGPAKGTLIMGRFLTETMLHSLAEQTRVTFSVQTIGTDQITEDEQAVIKSLETSPSVIRIIDDNNLTACGAVKDINGNNALLICADMKRAIFNKGKTAALFSSVSILIELSLIGGIVLISIMTYIISVRQRTAAIEHIVKKRTLELKCATAEAHEARISAEEASKAKSEFLANMSHEIRTPMNGIIGMAEIAMSTGLSDKQHTIFETINREARALLGIINSILDFSKIEARKIELETVPFDLKLLVEDIGKSVSFQAERKNLSCDIIISPDLPSTVRGDPGRLRQVIVNLTGNAIKFTHQGGITLKVYPETDHGDSVTVHFSVEDTGIGIDKDKQEKIFESFTQADGSTTRKFGGTGLGISISRQLIDIMGGTIGINSNAGTGSTFWFTVTLEIHTAELISPHSVLHDRLNILLICDNPEVSPQWLFIQELSMTPEATGSGKEALTILRERKKNGTMPNILIIEIQLPDTDGFTLATDIRELNSGIHIPTILTTRIGTRGDGKKCSEAGIDGYLTFPFDKREFKHAIELVLGRYSSDKPSDFNGLITRHTINEQFPDDISILLVEDYPTNRTVAVNHLENAGYCVTISENGQEAVDEIQNRSFDLILMDIQMPVMDGFEATRNIRRLEAEMNRPRTPVIAMTANAMKGDKEKCLDAGMDDYITKPLLRESMLATVAGWLKSAPGSVKKVADAPVAAQEDSDLETDQSQEVLPPIDYKKALDEFMGKQDVLMTTLNYFLNHGAEQLATIRQAISENDTETIRLEAHKLKGGAANLTMNHLSEIAHELEKAGTEGRADIAETILSKFETEFKRIENFLNTLTGEP